MPNTPSITTVKRFTYRGQLEEWSNTYHFAGAAPANAAGWKTLADALIAQEKTILEPGQKFVRAYGYEAGNEHSVAQIDYVALGGALVQGTLNSFGNGVMPGDAAFWVRAKVGTSSKGKNVYIRKYFHGATQQTSGADDIGAGQKAAAQAFAATMIGGGGPLPGGWCGPQGAAASAPSVSPFLTTRTLKRRGKRP